MHTRSPLIATLFALALALVPVTVFAQSPAPLAPTAQVKHPPIAEMSGIVKSHRYPDTYWVHNDSGDVARIFAIHADGSAIMPSWLKADFFADAPASNTLSYPTPALPAYPGIGIALATNYDWEDIAIDGDTLYIADTGNNGNARRDLGIYVVPEPNPNGVESTRPLKWLPIAYPDQKSFPPDEWRFDCEAIFVWKHKLYVVTKWRMGNKIGKPATGAALYRLDTEYTDKVNILKKLDTRDDLEGWVTAADVSPDGKTLALLCEAPVKSVWLFDISKGGDKLLSRPTRRLVLGEVAKQCEALCFADNETIIVGNENRDLFRLSTANFSLLTH